jgi:tRNA threonylcarbamoyladenosine biosynthesis protein TsaB
MAASCAEHGDHTDSLVLLETKRSDYYAQIYRPDGTPRSEPVCLSLTEALELYDGQILCGDAAARFAQEAAEKGMTINHAAIRSRSLPDPAILARLGAAKFAARKGQISKPEPLYLRNADVSVSNKIQRKIEEMPL